MQRRSFIAVLSAAAAAISTTATAQSDTTLSTPFGRYGKKIVQAPFGDSVSSAIVNYNRVAPYVANSGLLLDGGLEETKALGFKLLIDLRSATEKGAQNEEQRAKTIGLNYLRIPVSTKTPHWDQVDQFTHLIENTEHYPILVHCVSSNRSGAIWALYRSRMGVSPVSAIEEGRAAGLESREKAVRKMLKL